MDTEGPRTEHVVHTGSGRAIRLPIGPAQLASLMSYVETMISLQGCDNTLHHAEAWARAHGVPWGRLGRSLRGLGGFCDCEIGMNLADE